MPDAKRLKDLEAESARLKKLLTERVLYWLAAINGVGMVRRQNGLIVNYKHVERLCLECTSAESNLNRAKGSLQHMPLGQTRVSKPIRTAMASEAMETNPYAILAPRLCAS